MRRVLFVLVVLTLAACGGKPIERGHENLHAVLWTQTAVEYRALSRQSYELATRALDDALADPHWTAAVEQEGKAGYESLPPAVVLDIDETVLDNAMFQARLVLEDGTYDEEAWQAWCREQKATAIAGALAFTRYAAEKGVTVVYVTNRRKPVEDATIANLKAEGFDVEATSDPSRDRVLTRGENGWDSSGKTARRETVAARYRVLLLVGDNLTDFVEAGRLSLEERDRIYERYASYWGKRWIVLPNPQYGSWETAVFGDDFSLSDEERRQRKRDALKTGKTGSRDF